MNLSSLDSMGLITKHRKDKFNISKRSEPSYLQEHILLLGQLKEN